MIVFRAAATRLREYANNRGPGPENVVFQRYPFCVCLATVFLLKNKTNAVVAR